MRTNERMRRETRRNINEFFSSAQESLKQPDWFEVAKPFMTHLVVRPDTHWAFYDVLYDRASFTIADWNSVHIALPKKQYGYISGSSSDPHTMYPKQGYHSDWSASIYCKQDELPEDAKRYVIQHREMGEAAKALGEGAHEALKELTIERAIYRLPEMKRFLPEDFKRWLN